MTAMSRLDQLKVAIDRYAVQLEDTTQGEDLGPYLRGNQAIPRYAAVSHTHAFRYLTLRASERDAIAYLTKIASDDIYPEAPDGVLDLDTGTLRPVDVTVVPTWQDDGKRTPPPAAPDVEPTQATTSRCLRLSSAHLPRAELNAIGNASMRTMADRHGAWVVVPPTGTPRWDTDFGWSAERFPPGFPVLRTVVGYARELECVWVHFDIDAETAPGLETFFCEYQDLNPRAAQRGIAAAHGPHPGTVRGWLR
jgi:hypothetical protein